MAKSSGKAAERRPDGMPVGTPFESGKSGNPAGRKPGQTSIKAELQKILDLMVAGEPNPITGEMEEKMPISRKIALMLAHKAAMEKDTWTAFRIMEQLDGKAPQSLKLGGDDDNPAPVTFTIKIDNGYPMCG